MSTDPRWTEETEALVAEAMFTQDAGDAMSGGAWDELDDEERAEWRRLAAAAALIALAAAGLLVEPGSEVEYGVDVRTGLPDPDMWLETPAVERWTREKASAVAEEARLHGYLATILRRSVHRGPWREA